MDRNMLSATDEVFCTPELLEQILIYLLDDLTPVTCQRDPRSTPVYDNAAVLLHLLRCSAVTQKVRACIAGSVLLQRALYQSPDVRHGMTWDHRHRLHAQQLEPGDSSRVPAPMLNPVVQTIFKSYHFRYWHLGFEASNNVHCAYLIITRHDLPSIQRGECDGRGRSISSMLLSQPPCLAMEATIWEERDETKDYVGRTSALNEPVTRCRSGLTVGFVHRNIQRWFAEHQDVAAIKLISL